MNDAIKCKERMKCIRQGRFLYLDPLLGVAVFVIGQNDNNIFLVHP
jgi:hypothetical protein